MNMQRKANAADLLLAIDFQNVYMPGFDWACPSMPRSQANLVRLLRAGVFSREQVLFTQYVTPQPAVGRWQTYVEEYRSICENPYLSEITDEMKPFAKDHPLHQKSVYSSMDVPEIRSAAVSSRDRGGSLLLSGVVAECCVLSTLMQAMDLGCRVIYLTDCVSGQNEQMEEAVRAIAQSFSPVHTLVMTSEEYLHSLQA